MKTTLRSVNTVLGLFGLVMVVGSGDDAPTTLEIVTVAAWDRRAKIPAETRLNHERALDSLWAKLVNATDWANLIPEQDRERFVAAIEYFFPQAAGSIMKNKAWKARKAAKHRANTGSKLAVYFRWEAADRAKRTTPTNPGPPGIVRPRMNRTRPVRKVG